MFSPFGFLLPGWTLYHYTDDLDHILNGWFSLFGICIYLGVVMVLFEICFYMFLFQCRGLSDSVFGMSVVFAAIVMYDAQVSCSTF